MSAEKSVPEFPVPRVAVEGTVVAAEDGRSPACATVVYYFDPEEEYERETTAARVRLRGPKS